MARNNSTQSHFWRKFFSRLALVLLSVVIIVWFLPRTSGPQFRYDERDSILEAFEPYYNYNSDVEKEQIANFRNTFKNGIPGLGHEYIEIIADRLHRLYQAGVMSTPEYSRIGKDTTSTIRVVSGKTASNLQINCIYSTIAAYEQLFLDEKLAPQRPLLQPCNLNEFIRPNLIYDKDRSETEKNDLLSRGEIVDEKTFRELSSFEHEMRRRSATSSTISSTIAGQSIFVLILIALFTIYLALFRKDYFEKPRSITMLYSFITIFPIVVSLMMEHNIFSVYAVPFAMTPIFIRVFMDSRTAFIAHVVMILICAAAVKYQYEFIIIQLVAGLVAIYSLRDLENRSQLFRTAFLVALGSSITYLALQLMQDNSILTMDHSMYKHFIANGVMLLFAYPLMLVVEKSWTRKLFANSAVSNMR